MSMSSGYEHQGRTNQKLRTRQALIEAARSLLDRGIAPTVEQAAASALVSRPTAYRYFPNQQSLLQAAHPQLAIESMLPADAPEDPAARLEIVSRALMDAIVEHEVSLRAMLRLSLAESREPEAKLLALRTGRRIRWVDDALAPLRSAMTPDAYRTLTLQIASTLGIEPFIWLVDIAGLAPRDAAELLRANARTLLEHAR